MQSSSMNYRSPSNDPDLIMILLITLPVILLILFLMKRNGGMLFWNKDISKKQSTMQIVEQKHLPRGGFIIHLIIKDKDIYIIESNKQYLQLDLSLGHSGRNNKGGYSEKNTS